MLFEEALFEPEPLRRIAWNAIACEVAYGAEVDKTAFGAALRDDGGGRAVCCRARARGASEAVEWAAPMSAHPEDHKAESVRRLRASDVDGVRRLLDLYGRRVRGLFGRQLGVDARRVEDVVALATGALFRHANRLNLEVNLAGYFYVIARNPLHQDRGSSAVE